MGAPLTSDHVNYLIWRYLQEHGYGKAAIQLSRDWGNHDPQSLSFTDSVKPSFLIQMLQDGLTYDQLVSTVRQSQANSTPPPQEEEEDSAAQPFHDHNSGRRYGFVDIAVRRNSKRQEELSTAMAIEADARRKRPRTEPNGIPDRPQGRRRKSRSFGVTVQTNGEFMDVDTDETPRGGSAEEPIMEVLPVMEEPPPLIYTLDIGDSTGMQSDPIIDKTIAKTMAAISLPKADVTTLSWDEQEPDQLVVSGGFSFHTLAMRRREDRDDGQGKDLDGSEYELTPTRMIDAGTALLNWYYVPAVAAAEKGSKLAFMVESVDNNDDPERSIVLRAGDDRKLLARPSNTVISLEFNPAVTHVLALWPAPSSSVSNISIFPLPDSDGEESVESKDKTDSNQSLIYKTVFPTEVFSAAFIGSSAFVVAGDAILAVMTLQDSEGQGKISLLKSVETTHTWEHMAHDSHSKQLALISSDSPGTIGLMSYPDLAAAEEVDAEYTLITKEAHEDVINTIAWQPVPSKPTLLAPTKTEPAADAPKTNDGAEPTEQQEPDTAMATDDAPANHSPDPARLLATACTDGSVKLWSARGALECTRTLRMGPMIPAVALAFSPDGALVAAASEHLVLVWKVDGNGGAVDDDVEEDKNDHDKPVARWEEPSTQPEPVPIADDDVRMANGDEDTVSEAGEVGQGECYNLAWAKDGKRLAFSRGERVTVIGMPRSSQDL